MKQTEQDTAETLKVEKIIQKLEPLDICEWTMYKHSISIKTNGIEFYLKKQSYKMHSSLIKFHSIYSLSIKNIEDEPELIEHTSDCKNKTLGKMLEGFYEKTRTRLEEYKTNMLEERLDSFLSE
ncbi:MAG: hypothetical protein Q8O03_02765 [Nanoarchaeota archaeon]|nr:hypothetical protein [Nanoarchaeota archaeon]